MPVNRARSSSAVVCLSSPFPSSGSTHHQVPLHPRAGCSCHLRAPALLARQVGGPTLAAPGQVLAVGDQALVQLAGERGDAVHPRMVAKPMAGHADLAAAADHQHVLIEKGPLLVAAIVCVCAGRLPGVAGAGRGSSHSNTITENICTSRSLLPLASTGATSGGAPDDNDPQKGGGSIWCPGPLLVPRTLGQGSAPPLWPTAGARSPLTQIKWGRRRRRLTSAPLGRCSALPTVRSTGRLNWPAPVSCCCRTGGRSPQDSART